MSEKRSNLGTAGLVVAGGAILGAACYAAYEMFRESNLFRSEEVPHNSTQLQLPSAPRENRCCPICQRGYAEEPIQLPCEHHFHKICLQANRILHMDEDEYKCPVCKILIPVDFLNILD